MGLQLLEQDLVPTRPNLGRVGLGWSFKLLRLGSSLSFKAQQTNSQFGSFRPKYLQKHKIIGGYVLFLRFGH